MSNKLQAKLKQRPTDGCMALEMTMQEVMESLEDSFTYTAYQSTPDCLEILSIESPKADPFSKQASRSACKTIPLTRKPNPFISTIRKQASLERL